MAKTIRPRKTEAERKATHAKKFGAGAELPERQHRNSMYKQNNKRNKLELTMYY